MTAYAEKDLQKLFVRWYGQQPDSIAPLPPSGSSRQYFRIQAKDVIVVGASNPDKRENQAFLSFTETFAKMGLPVPQVLAADERACCYLLTDLGDTTLFSLLPHTDNTPAFDDTIIALYKQAITYLVSFQVDGAKTLDFGKAYPRSGFDRRSMMWDLNYFKYCYLKPFSIPFDEEHLENDFETFTRQLLSYPSGFFMYRDFQSRNIMISEGRTFFIDYQGGRKGPPAYDIASLLFDARANIPFRQREELLTYYIDALEEKTAVDRDTFRRSFRDLAVMRILQALGTYGYRGRIENKPLFLASLPYAYNNLAWLDRQGNLPGTVPCLCGIIRKISQQNAEHVTPPPDDGLTVRVSSFSYRKGAPADNSGHGGGFVFDCRALPNPGRLPQYKHLSGKDSEVIRYFEEQASVRQFMDATSTMVEQATEQYLQRGFTSLAVCFGCTGGQHRSVYCAEKLSRRLKESYNIHVVLQHFEEANWP